MKLTSLISAICHKDVEKIGFFGLGKSNTKLAEILQNEGWERGFTYRQSEPPKKNTELDIRHSYFWEKSL